MDERPQIPRPRNNPVRTTRSRWNEMPNGSLAVGLRGARCHPPEVQFLRDEEACRRFVRIFSLVRARKSLDSVTAVEVYAKRLTNFIGRKRFEHSSNRP